MCKRELRVYNLRYVRDILNQARNLYRTSLIRGKQTHIQTNKQTTATTMNESRNRDKGEEKNNTSSATTAAAAATKTEI